MTPVALSIAGFDPSSGAGITADLAAFAAHGVYGTSAISLWTVQSTRGVTSIEESKPELLRETLACLTADLPPVGIKIGALGGQSNAREVAYFLSNFAHSARVPVVVDPVLASSSGHSLFCGDPELFHELILPHATWVTPNWRELALLTMLPVTSQAEAEVATRALITRHRHLGVVATGGDQAETSDFFCDSEGSHLWLTGEKIDSTSSHGTGCAFSSAFLANLILGRNPVAAAAIAKNYVTQAILRAPGLGNGKGPLNLYWPLRTLPTVYWKRETKTS